MTKKHQRLRILSYNIHKGFTASNLDFVLERIKQSIEAVHADIVFLQEVIGHHDAHARHMTDWPTTAQFEFLADKTWPHFAYGKNAVYSQGHHGNAILSKFPFDFWENIDVSTNQLERRGMLHGIIPLPDHAHPLHVVCVHLGLFETGRRSQLKRLCERIEKMVPPQSPLIVAGDFNDWRETATPTLHKTLALSEAHQISTGEHARTFPSWLPVLRLDRIYVRGLKTIEARCLNGSPWDELSDHTALYAEFQTS